VHPKHLRWATHKENEADKSGHGTVARGERHGHSRLTPEDVSKIKKLAGAISQREIAKRFGIGQQNVSDIVCGRRWSWMEDVQ
jgi:hypothetical protein